MSPEANSTETTALAKVNPKQLQLKALLEKARGSMAAVLPRHLDPDRLIKIALVATSRSPMLLLCSAESILSCLMQSSQLGLEIGGVMGEAHMVPFKNSQTGQYEAQFVPGFRGLLKLVRQSGDVEFVRVECVMGQDRFKVLYHQEPPFVHEPVLVGDRGDILGAYCYIKLRDSGGQFAWMSREEIDAIRDGSRGKSLAPWKDHYPEMAKKTVIRRCVKYAPMSAQLAAAIEADNRAEGGDVLGYSELIDVVPPPETKAPASRGEKLKQRLAAKPEAPKADAPAPVDAEEAAAIEAAEREPGQDG